MEPTSNGRPVLTLAEIEEFDPHGAGNRRWCPLCGVDKPKDAVHRSLSLDLGTGRWKCFRCSAGGVVREKWAVSVNAVGIGSARNVKQHLRQERLRASFALGMSVAEPEQSLPPQETMRERGAPDNAAPGVLAWRQHWESCLDLGKTAGEKYLAWRGLPVTVAEGAGARFGPLWPGGASVVFPVLGRSGSVVAVQGRAVQGSAKRTYGPKKEGAFRAPVRLPSGRLLDPLDTSHEWIMVVEAPLDALSLAAAGYPALALCGTSGPSWLHLACGLKRVLLALDADEAGEAASYALEAQLKPYGSRCERLCPEGAKDWNEMLVGQGVEALSDWLAAHIL